MHHRSYTHIALPVRWGNLIGSDEVLCYRGSFQKVTELASMLE